MWGGGVGEGVEDEGGGGLRAVFGGRGGGCGGVLGCQPNSGAAASCIVELYTRV